VWPARCRRRQYKSHVRSHFFTNLGVAGGLLLVQTFGAGIYSVDAILKVSLLLPRGACSCSL